jgi:hypothetical protein
MLDAASPPPSIASARQRCACLPMSIWRGLITTAIEARASYLESIAALSWLIRNGGTPNGDGRAHQLVIGADTPPSQWREAQRTDGGMGERLTALLA